MSNHQNAAHKQPVALLAKTLGALMLCVVMLAQLTVPAFAAQMPVYESPEPLNTAQEAAPDGAAPETEHTGGVEALAASPTDITYTLGGTGWRKGDAAVAGGEITLLTGESAGIEAGAESWTQTNPTVVTLDGDAAIIDLRESTAPVTNFNIMVRAPGATLRLENVELTGAQTPIGRAAIDFATGPTYNPGSTTEGYFNSADLIDGAIEFVGHNILWAEKTAKPLLWEGNAPSSYSSGDGVRAANLAFADVGEVPGSVTFYGAAAGTNERPAGSGVLAGKLAVAKNTKVTGYGGAGGYGLNAGYGISASGLDIYGALVGYGGAKGESSPEAVSYSGYGVRSSDKSSVIHEGALVEGFAGGAGCGVWISAGISNEGPSIDPEEEESYVYVDGTVKGENSETGIESYRPAGVSLSHVRTGPHAHIDGISRVLHPRDSGEDTAGVHLGLLPDDAYGYKENGETVAALRGTIIGKIEGDSGKGVIIEGETYTDETKPNIYTSEADLIVTSGKRSFMNFNDMGDYGLSVYANYFSYDYTHIDATMVFAAGASVTGGADGLDTAGSPDPAEPADPTRGSAAFFGNTSVIIEDGAYLNLQEQQDNLEIGFTNRLSTSALSIPNGKLEIYGTLVAKGADYSRGSYGGVSTSELSGIRCGGIVTIGSTARVTAQAGRTYVDGVNSNIKDSAGNLQGSPLYLHTATPPGDAPVLTVQPGAVIKDGSGADLHKVVLKSVEATGHTGWGRLLMAGSTRAYITQYPASESVTTAVLLPAGVYSAVPDNAYRNSELKDNPPTKPITIPLANAEAEHYIDFSAATPPAPTAIELATGPKVALSGSAYKVTLSGIGDSVQLTPTVKGPAGVTPAIKWPYLLKDGVVWGDITDGVLTARQKGSYEFTLSVLQAGANGNMITRKVQVQIGDSAVDEPGRISFIRQPAARTSVVPGDMAQLSAQAVATPDAEVNYQWYTCTNLNGDGAQPIGDETRMYFYPPTDTKGAFYYFCRAAAGTLTADSIVATVVVADSLTVTYGVAGAGGTLTATVDGAAIASGSGVEEGKNVVFTARPEARYFVKAWTVNGVAVENNTTTTFTLTNLAANTTVTVAFEPEPQAIVLTPAPSPARIGAGQSVTVTATASPAGATITDLVWSYSAASFERSTANAESSPVQTFTAKAGLATGTYPISVKVTVKGKTLHAPALMVTIVETDPARYTATLLATKITVNKAKTRGALLPFTTNAAGWTNAAKPEVKLFTGYGTARQKGLETFEATWIDAGTIEISPIEGKSKTVKNVTVVLGAEEVVAGKLNITVNETYPKITFALSEPLNTLHINRTATLTAKSADGSAVTIESVTAKKGTVASVSGTTLTPVKAGTEKLSVKVRMEGYKKPNKKDAAISYSVKVTGAVPKLKLSMTKFRILKDIDFTMWLLPGDAKFPTLKAYLDSFGVSVADIQSSLPGFEPYFRKGDEPGLIRVYPTNIGKGEFTVTFDSGASVKLPFNVTGLGLGKNVTLKTTAKTATIHKNFTGKIIDLPLATPQVGVMLNSAFLDVKLPPALEGKVRALTTEGNVALSVINGPLPVGTHKISIAAVAPYAWNSKTKIGVKPLTYSLKVVDKAEGSASVSLKGKIDIANPESFATATVKLTNTAGWIAENGVKLTGAGSEAFVPCDVVGNTFKIKAAPGAEIVPGVGRKLTVELTLANGDKVTVAKQITVTPSQTKAKASQSVKEITLFEAEENVTGTVTLGLTTPANVALGAVKLGGAKAATKKAPAKTANEALGFANGSGFEVLQTGADTWSIGFVNGEVPVPAKGSLKASYTVKLELWAEGTYRLDANNEPVALTEGKKKSAPTTVSVKVSIAKRPAVALTVASASVSGGMLDKECGGPNYGGNVSPQLTWKLANVDEWPESYAILMYDTTKPGNGFVHWAAANVEGSEVAKGAALSGAELIVHRNDFPEGTGYGGPTPPSGTHTYHIVVYALKKNVAAGAGDPRDFGQAVGNNTWKKSRAAFEDYLGKDNILAIGQIVAKYK